MSRVKSRTGGAPWLGATRDVLPCPALACEPVVAIPEYCGYWDWCCTEAKVVALGGCAVWGYVLSAGCKRMSPINEVLRFQGLQGPTVATAPTPPIGRM